MRIVEFPFTYRVTGVAKGCRLPDDHVIQDSIPVSIREVSKAEAPEAITRVADAGTYVICRMIDGKALRPLRASTSGIGNDNTVAPQLSIDAFEREIAKVVASGYMRRWKSYPAPLDVSGYGPGVGIPDNANRHGEFTFREVHADHRDLVLSNVRKMAQHFVSVEGALWVAERAEQAWFVQAQDNQVRVALAEATLELKGWHRFAGNRKADAMTLAERLSARTGRPVNVQDVTINPVLDDWTINDAGGSLHKAAKLAYDIGATETFRDLPVEFFAPYAVLREAAKNDLVHLDMPKVASALGAFIVMAERHASPDDATSPILRIARQLEPYDWRARTLDEGRIHEMAPEHLASPDLGF